MNKIIEEIFMWIQVEVEAKKCFLVGSFGVSLDVCRKCLECLFKQKTWTNVAILRIILSCILTFNMYVLSRLFVGMSV